MPTEPRPARGRFTVRRLLAAISILILGVCAPARPGPALVETARLVPHDVTLFFAVDDAAELRRGPVGGFALALIDGVAGFTQTFEAWDRFAKELGWTPDQAFDALLGRRVVFASRRDPGAGGRLGAWVLMSEVSAESARRLSERLKPMPRQLVAGTPVLSVEGGRFQLGLVKRETDAEGNAEASFLLMLAEADGSEMLERSLREAKAGPERSLAGTEQGERLRSLARHARAVFFAEFSIFERAGDAPSPEPGAAPKPGWMVGAAQPVPGGVSLQTALFAPDFEAEARRQAARAKYTWDPAAFEALARDALFASVEASGSIERTPWGRNFKLVAAQLGLSSDIPETARFSGRMASLVTESPSGIIDLALAMESEDVAPLPALMDAEMARMVAKRSSEMPLPARESAVAAEAPSADATARVRLDPSTYDYAGAAPEATRRLDVSNLFGPAVNAAWPGGAHLVWRFDAHDPQADRNDAGGWWTCGLGESAVERLPRAGLLAPRAEGARLDWIAMVSARPRAVVERFEGWGVPIVRIVEPARWLKRVTWYSTLGPSPGLMLAGGRVEIEPPPRAEVPASQPAPPSGTPTTTPGR